MATLFSLTLSDGTETVEFVRGSNHEVADGGFDIGMPKKTRTISEVRPGFFRLISTLTDYRTATITFAVKAPTHQGLVEAIGKVERIINSIENDYYGDITNGQLKYQWDDQNPIYFEVYAGDLKMPADALSVGQVHKQINGLYVVHGIQLTLYMSPLGSTVPVGEEPMQEIPLWNPYETAPVTGGILVKNPQDGEWNFVQIAAEDVFSATPIVTKIEVQGIEEGWTDWRTLYIGKHVPGENAYPQVYYPHDEHDPTQFSGYTISIVNNSSADRGGYLNVETPDHPVYSAQYPPIAWQFPLGVGHFLVFVHLLQKPLWNYFSYSGGAFDPSATVGTDEVERYGMAMRTPFVAMPLTPDVSSDWYVSTFPLGVVKMPPVNPKIFRYGVPDPNIDVGIWINYSGDTVRSTPIDYVSLLPVTHGFRAWQLRFTNAYMWNLYSDVHIDDGWNGVLLTKDTRYNPPTVWNGATGLGSPIILTPNREQRLYFGFYGAYDGFTNTTGSENERNRQIKVRVFGVPTFQTLAY